jgi:hypothetical protein
MHSQIFLQTVETEALKNLLKRVNGESLQLVKLFNMKHLKIF